MYSPYLPPCANMPLVRMVKEFDPITEKFVTMDDLMLSMAVRIPTKAVMPIAMIAMVSNDRNMLLLIALKASCMFRSHDKKQVAF